MFWLGVLFGARRCSFGPFDSCGRTIRPAQHPGYPTAALRSLIHLRRGAGASSLAARAQAMLFASFIAFWTVLSSPAASRSRHLDLGAENAGLFDDLVGSGILAAPLAGQL